MHKVMDSLVSKSVMSHVDDYLQMLVVLVQSSNSTIIFGMMIRRVGVPNNIGWNRNNYPVTVAYLFHFC